MEDLCCRKNCDSNQIYAALGVTSKEGDRVVLPICTKERSHMLMLMADVSSGRWEEVDKSRIHFRGKKAQEILEKKMSEMRSAPDDWEWEDDMDRWRNAVGDIVRIRHMSDDEILDAVHAIWYSNFDEETPRGVKWALKLRIPGKDNYPTKNLYVSVEDALAKLDEFREELVNRGKIKR